MPPITRAGAPLVAWFPLPGDRWTRIRPRRLRLLPCWIRSASNDADRHSNWPSRRNVAALPSTAWLAIPLTARSATSRQQPLVGWPKMQVLRNDKRTKRKPDNALTCYKLDEAVVSCKGKLMQGEYERHSQCQKILEDLLEKYDIDKVTTNDSHADRAVFANKVKDLLNKFQTALRNNEKKSTDLFVSEGDKERLARFEQTSKGRLWHYPEESSFNKKPYGWNEVTPIDRCSLEEAIAEYLDYSVFQHNLLEWCSLNALLFDETARTAEDVKSGIAFWQLNLAYAFADGDLLKTTWFTLGFRLLRFFARWVIPGAAIIGLVYFGYETPATYVGGAYAIFLVYRAIMIPFRWGTYTKRRKQRERYQALTEAMFHAWRYTNSPVFSPTRLNELVMIAEDLGARYSPSIHALLARAIQRDPSVFIRRRSQNRR